VAYYLTSSSSKPAADTGSKKKQSTGTAKKAKKDENKKDEAISDNAPSVAAPTNSAAETTMPQSAPTQAPSVAVASSSAAAAVVVEDDGADEEENAEETVEELTKRYDDALRLAKKYLQGEKYSTAAAKFSEAIDLASRIPSAGKDLVTLYNNRSAMFEKNNELDASLQDIMIVLALDTKHQKARARRARILERKGDFQGALDDCVFCSILEGASGQPASNTTKVVELCKKVSEPEVRRLVDRIRSSSRAVPNKAYCRSYFESFPSFHEWKQIYEKVDRDELVRRSYTALDLSPAEVARKELLDALELIKLDASRQNFNKAFAHIERSLALIEQGGLSSDALSQLAIAELEDMQGTEAHLRCNLSAAMKRFISALARLGANPSLLAALDGDSKIVTHHDLGITKEKYLSRASEISLKLASTYIELGEPNKV
jgi:tetratricopeptide (TPR) repeat protein